MSETHCASDELSAAVLACRQRIDRNRDLVRLIAEREEEINSFVLKYRTIAFINRITQDRFRAFRFLSQFIREKAFGASAPVSPPPREVDAETLHKYTLDGQIPFYDQYIDDTYPSNHPLIYTKEETDFYSYMLSKNQFFVYGKLDTMLQEAFDKYPVSDVEVLVTGSITPWYETICLRNGGRPVTVDYNPIISRCAEIETLTVDQVEGRVFDCALSISSFEHDGLGAYGDPIDPEGDLKAMRNLKNLVRPGGLLFLNVPCGPDAVYFNRMRVYGAVRLPLMFEGWEIVDRFGYSDDMLVNESMSGNPLFVLRNSAPEPT